MSTEPVLPELPPGRVQIGLTPPFKEVIYGADAVRAIQSAAFKAGREQGLREAAQKCETRGKTGRYKARRVEALELAFEIRSMAEGSATRSGCEEGKVE